MMERYVSYLAVNQSVRHELGRTQAVIVILSDVQDDFECEDTRSFFSATMNFTRIVVSVGDHASQIESEFSCLQPHENVHFVASSFSNLASTVFDVTGLLCND
eukprot:UN09703